MAWCRFILLQNRAGKTRLAKYYVPTDDPEKRKVEYEVHRLVVNRDPKHTNFVEVGRGVGAQGVSRGRRRGGGWGPAAGVAAAVRCVYTLCTGRWPWPGRCDGGSAAHGPHGR